MDDEPVEVEVGVGDGAVEGLVGGVGEDHADAGADHGLEPGQAAQLLGLLALAPHLLVVDPGSEGVDLGGEGRRPGPGGRS